MRMNSYSRYPSVAVPFRFSAVSICIFFVFFFKRFLKQSMSVAIARSCVYRLVTFLLLLGAVAEAKLQLATPSSAGIIPFRYVANCYFTLRMPVLHHPVQTFVSRIKPLFLSPRILFYGSNLCIV